jgi:hypothetical protein
MQKRLTYISPPPVPAPTIGRPEKVIRQRTEGNTVHYEEVEVERVRDIGESSILTVFAEDAADLEPALRWHIGDDFTASLPPAPRGKNGTTVEWQIPGRFAPSPSAKDLHAIVEDYKVLSPAYPTYGHVLGLAPWVENQGGRAAIRTQKDTLIFETLLRLIEAAGISDFPAWIKRTLEIRCGR